MTVDGIDHPLAVSESKGWRRVSFDFPARMSAQLMDDTFISFASKIDTAKKSVELSKPGDEKWRAALTVEQTAPSRMTLSGAIDGKQTWLRLELFPRENFLLVRWGFNRVNR
jgi:hypothetical protein